MTSLLLTTFFNLASMILLLFSYFTDCFFSFTFLPVLPLPSLLMLLESPMALTSASVSICSYFLGDLIQPCDVKYGLFYVDP